MKNYFRCFYAFLFILILTNSLKAQIVPPPVAFGPVPTSSQLEWQQMEMNMFCHFGPNTFTGKEWGDGTEIEDIFNPTDLNCRQWTEVAKKAGFKGIIVTAKHHDGFCLWPNPMSEHTVAQSVWKNGKGDVLRDLSDACRNAGMKFGIYISPWDRNAPTYGTSAYNNVFLKTLESALSHYGPVFEQWFDGACGEGPNGKRQVYDWSAFNGQVARWQPQAVIFSDVGPGCRWVGNEQGRASQMCWSRLDADGFGPGADAPSTDTLMTGNVRGKYWIPAEADVSIRNGWFYRESEHPKTLQQLLEIYYTSVGRNALLLLNVPPDQRGWIPAEDSIRLMEFYAALDTIFAQNLAQNAEYVCASNIRGAKSTQFSYWRSALNSYLPMGNDDIYGAKNLLSANYHSYWAVDDTVQTASLILKFSQAQTFNRVLLQEYIPFGQRIAKFHFDILLDDGTWKTVASEFTIGYKRILLIPTSTTRAVRLTIDETLAPPVLNQFGLYYDTIYEE